MSKLKKAIAVSAMLILLCSNVFAEANTLTYAKAENGKIIGEVNSSNLNVNVIKQQGDTRTTIFTGKLKDYDNGRWINLDFSEIQIALILNWDTMENEAIYIIPNKADTANTERNVNEVNGMANVSDITYDVTYTVSNDNMNILYSVNNAANTAQTVNMISALYRNGVLQHVITTPLTVNADTVGSGSITMILPETDKKECSVKMMAWESMGTLRPLGSVKEVKDIEPYLREKTIAVSADAEREFNLYMSSDNAIGNNSAAEHVIKFNPQKFEVIDMCGLTYEKELAPQKIENIGITIQSVDTENGKIIFNFDLPEGRNNGINNVVKFRAISDASDEEIIYEIQ